MSLLPDLVRLSNDLGREERQLAILGEGNTSADCGNGTFFVKASGSSLGTLTESDLTLCSFAKVAGLLDATDLDEQAIEEGLLDCRVDPNQRKPSIETFLHALCLTEGGAKWVGHTHPNSVISIVASQHGATPFHQHICPDFVVVCGRKVAVVPYVSPGIDLAHATRKAIRDFSEAHNDTPKVILLENHGAIALGQSPTEVMNITLMLDKWARILIDTLSIGGPRPMPDGEAERLDQRLDEIHRRRVLAP